MTVFAPIHTPEVSPAKVTGITLTWQNSAMADIPTYEAGYSSFDSVEGSEIALPGYATPNFEVDWPTYNRAVSDGLHEQDGNGDEPPPPNPPYIPSRTKNMHVAHPSFGSE